MECDQIRLIFQHSHPYFLNTSSISVVVLKFHWSKKSSMADVTSSNKLFSPTSFALFILNPRQKSRNWYFHFCDKKMWNSCELWQRHIEVIEPCNIQSFITSKIFESLLCSEDFVWMSGGMIFKVKIKQTF